MNETARFLWPSVAGVPLDLHLGVVLPRALLAPRRCRRGRLIQNPEDMTWAVNAREVE
jgi:hypothetical protein